MVLDKHKELLEFLQINDIVNLKQVNKSISKLLSPKIINKLTKKVGINPNHRINYWKWFIKYFEKSKKLNVEEVLKEVQSLRYLNSNEEIKKIERDISNDLNRTFSEEKFKNDENKKKLHDVLLSIAFLKPKIGYCQGMNFIAASTLMFFNWELGISIDFMYFLIEKNDMTFMFVKNMPDYFIKKFQLDYYTKIYIPEIHYHFKRNPGISDIIFSKWIITIFSNYLTHESLGIVWDYFLIDRWKAIIKFSIAFLLELKDTLIKIDLDTISDFLKDNLNKEFEMKNIRKIYNSIKVTNRQLISLREEYFLSLLKMKLDGIDASFDDDQVHAINKYRTENDRLEKLIKNEILFYQKQLQSINLDYNVAKEELQNQININDTLSKSRIKLIENKSTLEMSLILLRKEANNQKLNNKIIHIKIKDIFPGIFKSSKVKIIEDEIKSIQQKIINIQYKIDMLKEEINKNLLFLQIKIENKTKLKNEKLRYKSMLEGYLKMCEIKQKDILNSLLEKLKSSEKFINTCQF